MHPLDRVRHALSRAHGSCDADGREAPEISHRDELAIRHPDEFAMRQRDEFAATSHELDGYIDELLHCITELTEQRDSCAAIADRYGELADSTTSSPRLASSAKDAATALACQQLLIETLIGYLCTTIAVAGPLADTTSGRQGA